MYITLNSQFKPFTYDELVKPLQDYGEAYREVEKEYTDLASQTSAWENIIKKEIAPESHNLYLEYSNALNKVVDAFTTEGMTAKNRGALLKLKAGYEKSIGAIDKAYTAMKEHNALVDAAGPDAVFVKGRSNNIDDFLYGQHIDNTYISKKDLETSVIGDVLASANTKYAELISAGYKPDVAISKIASGEFIDNNELITNVQSKIGGYDTFDGAGKKQIEEVINSGVTKGLGSFVDKQMMDAAQRDASARGWNSLDLNNRQFNFNLQKSGYKLENGKPVIDTDNPVWAAEGITFKKNSDGSIKKDSNNNPIPIPNPEKKEERGEVETYQKGTITTKDGIVNLENFKKKYPKGGSYVEFDDLDQNSRDLLETFYPDMTLAQRRNYRYSVYKNSEGKVAGIEPIEKTTKKEEKVSNKDLTNVSFVE